MFAGAIPPVGVSVSPVEDEELDALAAQLTALAPRLTQAQRTRLTIILRHATNEGGIHPTQDGPQHHEHSGWLHSRPASRAVSHAEAAASVARANREAAAAAAAVCDDSSDDGDDAEPRLRCIINGCRWQLLSCSGR